MKYVVKITIVSSTIAFGLLQGMEQEQKLIPGLPNPPEKKQQEEAVACQMDKTTICTRIAEALETKNSLKKEELEIAKQELDLRKRIFYLNNARAIYNSFSSGKKETDLSRLYQQVGGRERRNGISEADALAALTVIVRECENMQELMAQLNKSIKRKKVKKHSPRDLNQGESNVQSKKRT